MRRHLFFLLLLSTLTACNLTVKKNEDKGTSAKSETSEGNIRNDIDIKAKGVTVQQAFLLFDDGKLVPGDNKIEVGQKVRMRILVDGWKPVNGKVVLGASEKVTTDDGKVILEEQDLFQGYPDGLDPKDASVLSVMAVITSIDKLYKYFEVSVRIWDKNSTDEVSGTYKIYLK